jgi:hypothetical protein
MAFYKSVIQLFFFVFYSLTTASFPIWLCFHLNMEKILSIKLASAPPTLISVSLSHGNGSIGLVASSRSSIVIFGFDRSSGPIW